MREKDNDGFPAWAIGTVFVGLALLTIAPWLIPTAHRGSSIIVCPANLKNIGLGCITYVNNNKENRFPDTIEQLILIEEMSPCYFICPGSKDTPSPGTTPEEQASHLTEGGHCSYIYVGRGLTASLPNPDKTVLAYEPLSNHRGTGGNFLFANGVVRFVPAEQAKALIAAIPESRRPVRR